MIDYTWLGEFASPRKKNSDALIAVHLRRRGLLPRPLRPSARAHAEGKRRRQRRLSIPNTPGSPHRRPAEQRLVSPDPPEGGPR